jgi:hypothetical protein
MIQILSPLAPAGQIMVSLVKHNPNFVSLAPASHILVDLVKQDTNIFFLAPAGYILVNLVKHAPNCAQPGTSWSHFGRLGQTQYQFCPPWRRN